MMVDERRLRFKILSLLLQFPDEALTGGLDSIEEAVKALHGERPRRIIEGFLFHLRHSPLIDLQEEYTRVFDLTPSTSLNLTYHTLGNDRKRGGALARLNGIYRSAGYEIVSGELPDFLPAVLEFLSTGPEEICEQILGEHHAGIAALASRLRETASVYADLLEALPDAGRPVSAAASGP